MKPVFLPFFIAVFLMQTSPVAAQAVEFFKCALAEDATMEALHDATVAMLETAHANGQQDYTVSFLNPLYAADTKRGMFVWVGSAPSFAAVGAFNDYWDSEVNRDHRAQWRALTTGCESASLYGASSVGDGIPLANDDTQ